MGEESNGYFILARSGIILRKKMMVFDEPVVSAGTAQEVCNKYNNTEKIYQQEKRMVLWNITNWKSIKSAFGEYMKCPVGDVLIGPKAFNSLMETLEKLSRRQYTTSFLSLIADTFNIWLEKL